MTPSRNRVPFRLYRGGTSKGVFMPAERLPRDRAALVPLLLEIFGSPDPRQIDGMGGGDKLTSKAGIMGPPTVPDADVDYLFAQVGIRYPEVDFNLNCGNLTAAAAVYAVHEGFVRPRGENVTVRIHNVNTGCIICATVPLRDDEVQEEGGLAIGGVPGTGAAIDLDFAHATGAITGELLPMGEAVSALAVPGHGCINVSVVDGPNLIVLVAAEDLGMSGLETPDEIDGSAALTGLMQAIRAVVAERVGLGDYWRNRAAPSNPMLIVVRSPADYRAYTTRDLVAADTTDLICRQYSTAATSKALAATAAAAIGMACRIPGTVAARYLRPGNNDHDRGDAVRLGHPCGTMTVRAHARLDDGAVAIEKAVIQRTCRLIAAGELYVRRGPYA